MRVTPLDIIQKQFGPARRGGYDSDEVRAFLDEVRDALEESLKDNQRLREQLQRRESEIVELRSGEGDIKDTLLLARRLSEDMERSARREVDVILGEARLEAEKVLQTAAEERRALQAELVRLRSTRIKMVADLRGLIDGYGRMVDAIDAEGLSPS
jgi:DivIVA domain-containing protein